MNCIVLRAIAVAAMVAAAAGLPSRTGPAAAAALPDLSPDPLRYVSPSRPYDTVHTALDLDIDLEAQTVAGSVTHTMRSLRSGLERFDLNCVELEVESVTVDGAPAAFEYPVTGDRVTSWLGRDDVSTVARADDRLVVELPEPFERGREFTVTVTYRGHPKRGLYWIQPEKGLPEKRYEVWSQGEGEDNRYWIPCHDYPDDVATFEGRFRVDAGLYALSNGTLVSRRDAGDGKTEFHWRLDAPQVTYLIMLAVAGYDVHEQEGPGGVPLLYVVPPGTPRETVERGFGRTADMVDFFNRAIGIDYPWGKYAQVAVQNFIYGGMENTTATVMNLRTLYDERTALTDTEDYLVAHELAHQWWGDMVTCREWSHMWLNEGFATYYADLYKEYREGDDAFRYQMLERHRNVVAHDATEPRPAVTDFFNRTGPRNNFNIYQKGASVLHMLRFILGDEDYAAALRLYGERHKYGVVETYDFTRAVKDATGRNLDWFFEQWIYLAGHPEFRVAQRWDADSGALTLSVRQTQNTGGITPLFRVPLDVEITTENGAALHRVVIERESHEFVFDCDSKPLMVIFDKGDWNLKTLHFDKRPEDWRYQLAHGDYIERVRAAVALGDAPRSDETVDALAGVAAAAGVHYGLRREAALALGKLGGERALDALLDGLAAQDPGDPDAARLRLACAQALRRFPASERAAASLRGALERDRAWAVRAKAVESLVAMEADGALEACYEAISQDSDQEVVRKAGLEGLKKLGRTEAMPRLTRYIGPGNDRNYRHAAIAAYATLAKDSGGRERRDAVDALAPMLDDWYLRTRRAVIQGLRTIGDPAAIPHLERAARSDPLESLRARAGKAAAALRAKADTAAAVEDIEAKVRQLESRIDALDRELDDDPR